ncbi:MAG: polysaccharide deacetylase family protein [Actinobacteria bacterium]|nr:polysaccharide deacetylase family protein [Actinomycetota bacterium]
MNAGRSPRRGRKRDKAASLLLVAALSLAAVLCPGGMPAGERAAASSSPRAVLTFDDGYGFDHRILDFLSSRGIAASAFVIGSWAQRNPELLKEMNALGWDICNHTQNHPWLTRLTDDRIRAELNACQAAIASITGQNLPVFRPPGGFIDARVTAAAASVGLSPVMWDFDSMDALNTSLSVQERVNRMVASARDGSIILFHFGGRGTIDLVTGVVEGLRRRGFTFVTLSELYGWKKMVRGGEAGPGAREPALRQVFAEGTTREGFEEWLLVFNPNPDPAALHASYYAGEEWVRKEYEVPARGRLSVAVNREVPWRGDVAAVLEASLPVVAERSIYFNRGGGCGGGTTALGVAEGATVHYLPEGTVRLGFEAHLALFNPGARTAAVRVALHGAAGEAWSGELELRPLMRLTLRLNDLVPEGDYSATVHATEKVAVERSQYFVYDGFCPGASCSPGMTEPATKLCFAEGTTRERCDSYLALFNPCAYATCLVLRMHVSDGSVREERMCLGAGERKTLRLDRYLPPGCDYSLEVLSLLPVAAERAAYFQDHNLAGGFCDVGVADPSRRWIFAEGSTGPGFRQWLILFNPNPRELAASVTYLCSGEELAREYPLPPGGRVTVDVGAEVGERPEVAMEVSCEEGIAAERALYFDRMMP